MKKALPKLCLIALTSMACHRTATLFEAVPSSRSGIHFDNRITENDSMNPMKVVNIYNGGGVGVGDFDGDGRPDLYFTGNQVASRLYLNRGDFHFEDVTEKAGVAGMGRWARGVAVVDINNDGRPDLYICNTVLPDSAKRRNILYVNQGNGPDGIPRFRDMAAEYGLDVHVQSTMANFFDYDNDGDLDMYLTVNEASIGGDQSVFVRRNMNTGAPSRGRLFRNDFDPALGHGVFHDVSAAAGIVYDGYGHSATVCDINQDGWKDIYVSDDFISGNLLYINNHDGTFRESAKDYFKHTSLNAMGQDIADINNDGLPDVVELDMNPEDNYRKKMMLGTNSYVTFQQFDIYGYQYQYVRNTLQLNQGPRVLANDSIGAPAFSEIGWFAGIAQTDWSWTPLVQDFDDDGFRDLVVTNGFPRDVSDHDFIAYRQHVTGYISQADLLAQIPQVKLHNYAFRNRGDLSFADESKSWGLGTPSFSNGAAVADLDGDGALDLVVNNIDDEAFVYRNTARDSDSSLRYLTVHFRGDAKNRNGIGAIVHVYYDHGKQQMFENTPYRGYLSTMEAGAHFGLGHIRRIDSLRVDWPGRLVQVLDDVETNRVLTLDAAQAHAADPVERPVRDTTALFTETAEAQGIRYKHADYDLIDFDVQALLPHKLSEYCPALAVADLDGNGTDDLVVGGNANHHAQLFLQQPSGLFTQQDIQPDDHNEQLYYKDEGILAFDADGDGKTDLYISRGGYRAAGDTAGFRDILYLNEGNGKFRADSAALPAIFASKLCVRAFDYNHDGKPDLFVSGRVVSARYPQAAGSFIFRNDSKPGAAKFTDVTAEVAPDLQHIGLVCDAIFSDYDGDGRPDLILAGEWMPVTFLHNEGASFANATAATGLASRTGWWNSIAAGDFRHTGRLDYIVGNAGLNTFYQASEKYPVRITAGDFTKTGAFVAIPSLYLPDQNGVKKEFPAQGRDDVARQFPAVKKKFAMHRPFAVATMDDILTPEQRKSAIRLEANTLASVYLRNEGGGRFTMIPLPSAAQFSTIDGMVVDDFDGDGNADVLMNSNDYATEVGTGRYDAMNGLLLRGDGKGGFVPLPILQSGLYIPGNGKALVKLRGAQGDYLVAASQNRGPLRLFKLRRRPAIRSALPGETGVRLKFRDGSVQQVEFHAGESFLSQSAPFFILPPQAEPATR